jgi:hypothetical protein
MIFLKNFSYNLDVNGSNLKPKKKLFELGLTLFYYLEHGWKHGKVKTKNRYRIKILGLWIKRTKSKCFYGDNVNFFSTLIINYCWHWFQKLNWYNCVFPMYLLVLESDL